ncbi:MAG: VPS10 domain-containing protein [Bacteroidia bacterium]
MKRIPFFLLLTLCSAMGFAQNPSQQNWQTLWQTPGANFYDIQQAFQTEWADKEAEMLRERSEGVREENEQLEGTYFLYKRWEDFMAPRVFPSGDLSITANTWPYFMDYLNQNPAAMAAWRANQNPNARSSSAWNFVGPTGAPSDGGAGRINFVRFMPGNNNILFGGAPAGGLWKSIDGGGTWVCLTDNLPVIGCSDLAIDPTNTNIMYLATGDHDGGDSPSIGVLKTTDGGLTWNTTGLSFTQNLQRKISKILIHPTNSNIIYAGTSAGVYKSLDGGVNWFVSVGYQVKDMEFKPGDPNTLYIVNSKFYYTTNGGYTWIQTTTGVPAAGVVSRMAIAVTPANPEYVYLLAGETGTQGFQGMYRSVNSGVSFASQASSPNLLGWSPSGSDTDGQAWYDLAVAASPTDPDEVFVGGVNIWRSTDGGVNWDLNAHWYGGGGAPYVHADVHGIEFLPNNGSSIFVACDGGVFKTTNNGNTWADISSDMCIAQIYRLGLSANNAGILITGHQDNGSNLKNGNSYAEVLGGDGMDCFIDRTNNNVMYAELYYGDFNRSTNGGNSWTGITTGLTGTGGWITPWCQDPLVANTLYAGYDQVFKSTNQGNSWSQLGTMQNGGSLVDIEVAPTNTQYIYACSSSAIFRSSNGGATWTTITGTISTSGSSISRIGVSPQDEQTLWVTLSGYNNNYHVFVTHNAGATWTNISNGLPNLPTNCVAAIPGAGNHAVFVGCDVGVYYRDDNMSSWQPFFTGLPNTPVSDLKVFLPTMTLRASTYGRGVWESPIDLSLLTSDVNFSANNTLVCPAQTVQFTDLSSLSPTAWSWNFPGGTPSSSSLQNPTVVYNTPGVYPVTLTATNIAGAAVESKLTYITVTGALTPPVVEGFVSSTFVPTGWSMLNAGNQNFVWQRSSTVGHNSSESAYFNNFNNVVNSDRDELRSPGINFTGYTSLQLDFDVAYARYNNTRSDSIEVLISSDCGVTFTSVFLKGGTQLATAPDQTSLFTPTNNQWRTETINLNAYAGQTSVMVVFRNRGYHGQFIYLDNINISGSTTLPPTAAFAAPATVCQNGNTNFTDLSAPAATSWTWDFPGATPNSSSSQNPIVSYNAAGTYTVTLIVSNANGNDTLVQTITVSAAPNANAGSDTSLCNAGFVTLNATGAATYSWSPATGLSNAFIQNPTFIAQQVGTQTFVLTTTDVVGCSSSDSVEVRVNALPGFTPTSATSICFGDTTWVTCNNPNLQYTWNPTINLNSAANDSALVWPYGTTTYSVTGTDTNGCVASSVRTLIVLPQMQMPTVLVNGFMLTCSPAAPQYQWYFNGTPIAGATSQTYTALNVGMYSVATFTSSGCTGGESQPTLVNGVPPNEAAGFFVVAPNPNNGQFLLSFEVQNNDDYILSVCDALGREIYSETLAQFNGRYSQQLDLTPFGSGTFLIRLTNSKQETVRRVLIY